MTSPSPHHSGKGRLYVRGDNKVRFLSPMHKWRRRKGNIEASKGKVIPQSACWARVPTGTRRAMVQVHPTWPALLLDALAHRLGTCPCSPRRSRCRASCQQLERSLTVAPLHLAPSCPIHRSSALSARRTSRFSCSARTPVRSPGLSSTADSTRRASPRRLPRSARARLSSTSVVSLVPRSSRSTPAATRSPRSVLPPARPPLPRARRTRRPRLSSARLTRPSRSVPVVLVHRFRASR